MSRISQNYFRRLSRKTKIPMKIIEGKWSQISKDLILEGYEPFSPVFVQILNKRLRENINFEENNDCLNKFKKFL